MKSGSSNLLANIINSKVALRIAVFWSILRDSLPNSKIFVRRESVLSNSLLSRLRKLLKRVLLLFVNKGQWRKKWPVNSTLYAQLHKGLIESLKLCFSLCSRKWLDRRRSLVISFMLFGLWEFYTEFEDSRITAR